MIKRENILKDAKPVVSEKVIEKIKASMSISPTMGGTIRTHIVRMEISRSTSAYLKDIVLYFSKVYDDLIVIVPDRELPFGALRVYTTFCMLPETYQIITTDKTIDTKGLDDIITMENPKYLVMSRNTLSLLKNTDDYLVNDKAYYHSYKKIPIAITEFLNPGEIDIIE